MTSRNCPTTVPDRSTRSADFCAKFFFQNMSDRTLNERLKILYPIATLSTLPIPTEWSHYGIHRHVHLNLSEVSFDLFLIRMNSQISTFNFRTVWKFRIMDLVETFRTRVRFVQTTPFLLLVAFITMKSKWFPVANWV